MNQRNAIVIPTSIDWLRNAAVAHQTALQQIQPGMPIDCFIAVAEGDVEKASKELSNGFFNEIPKLIGVSESHLEGLPIQGRWGRISWYRALLPEIEPLSRYHKLLLLGVDTFTQKDISHIFRTTFSTPLAAIREPKSSPAYLFHPFDQEGASYFNADVLLYDVPKWIDEKHGPRIRDFAVNATNVFPYGDQDILNLCLADNWIELPIEMNWIPALHNLHTEPSSTEARVIQWAGVWKPWDSAWVAPFCSTSLWRRHYMRIWGQKPPKSINRELRSRSLLRQILSFLSFYAPQIHQVIIVGGAKCRNMMWWRRDLGSTDSS